MPDFVTIVEERLVLSVVEAPQPHRSTAGKPILFKLVILPRSSRAILSKPIGIPARSPEFREGSTVIVIGALFHDQVDCSPSCMPDAGIKRICLDSNLLDHVRRQIKGYASSGTGISRLGIGISIDGIFRGAVRCPIESYLVASAALYRLNIRAIAANSDSIGGH
jgi:hypothetical protein